MEKTGPNHRQTKNNHLDNTNPMIPKRTDGKSFKQKLIQNLLLEVKRTTQVIESYNKLFFLDATDEEAQAS